MARLRKMPKRKPHRRVNLSSLSIKVTLESFAFHGANADVMLRMDNLADEEKSIALLLFIDAQSESGELADYDYAKTNCDGTIPPKGSFKCKLALVLPTAPKQVALRVGAGMGGEVVTFNLPTGTP